MLKIRMTRQGRTNRPFFRIGVYDIRTRREGMAVEMLGYYDPIAAGQAKPLVLNEERLKYWLSQGAIPSETIGTILKKLKMPFSHQAKRTAQNKVRQERRLAKKKAAKSTKKSA